MIIDSIGHNYREHVGNSVDKLQDEIERNNVLQEIAL